MQKSKIQDFLYSALFAALICVLAAVVIPLPFTPVPISGQSLGVMLAGCILTPRQAGLSLLVFLLLGAVGLPVFAGFNGGIGIIIGPRGGYLIGYMLGAIVIALLKGNGQKWWRLALANIIGGMGVVYLIGLPWLDFFTNIGLTKAIYAGLLPFLICDSLKVIIATILALAINKRLSATRGTY